MKKVKLCSLFLLMLFLSCSKEEQIEEELSMEVEFLTQKFEVDQAITLNIKSNQDIFRFGISKDHEGFYYLSLENYGKSVDITFSLDKIGRNTIEIFIESKQKEVLKKSIDLDVKKGNSVKIKSLRMVSFPKMNEVWDAEYSNTDINRLADLQFRLKKNHIATSFNKEILFGLKKWHVSDILFNQGNLTWELSNKNINIDPNLKTKFRFGDVDEDGSIIILYKCFPDCIEFSLKEYIKDKPKKIILKRDDIDLEIELELEW
ncbi:hypothetical protein [uncultured Tenacibaculum sp.]|uniref:hypothetical protein n=1 Tax=uncultured Tenacibaculum sp. TaxID=174713 RepID=UPI0026325195|nr:hypothetical protein [uncultured Tenacibaculum sp.]